MEDPWRQQQDLWHQQHLDRTFVSALREVRDIAKVSDPDEALCHKAGQLLRMLIADTDCLVKHVTGADPDELRFIVREYRADVSPPEEILRAVGIGQAGVRKLDRDRAGYLQGLAMLPSFPEDIAYPAPLLKLSLLEFLENQVGEVAGQVVRVKDLVRDSALVGGQVHAFAPGNARQRGIFAMNKVLGDAGLSPFRMLPIIGRITAHGLMPLSRRVQANLDQPQ